MTDYIVTRLARTLRSTHASSTHARLRLAVLASVPRGLDADGTPTCDLTGCTTEEDINTVKLDVDGASEGKLADLAA